MTLPDAGRWKPRAAAWTALVVGTACWLAGTAAVAQQKPLKPQAQAQQSALRLNDREYFETRGLNVLVFTNQYNGMFFDEKTAGIEIIQHGVRLATGGAVRLSPTPEQWDQIPKVVDRKVDKAANTITCVLRYEAFDFDSRLVVTPEGAGFRVAVYRRQAGAREARGPGGAQPRVPAVEVLRADVPRGRQARHLPALSHRARRRPSPATRRSASSRATRRSTIGAGTSTWRPTRWRPARRSSSLPRTPSAASRSRPSPASSSCSTGATSPRTAGSSSARCCASKATGKVAEWVVRPNVIPNWTRTPVIGFSQVGYHPAQKKVAVIELDANDTALPTASLFEVTPDGAPVERLKAKVQPWGSYLRYKYVTADFSAVDRAGPVLHPVRQAEDGDVPDRPERLRHHLARDGGRLVPGADGPHDGQRGLPRVARPAAHGRRAAGPAELPALRRLPDGGVDRDEVQAPRAHPGPRRRRLVRRRRLRHPGRLPRRHDHGLRGHLGGVQAAARPDVHRSGEPLRRHSPPGRQAGRPAADRARGAADGGSVPGSRSRRPWDRRLAPSPVPSSRRRVDADRQPDLRPLAQAVPGGRQPERHARRPVGLHRTHALDELRRHRVPGGGQPGAAGLQRHAGGRMPRAGEEGVRRGAPGGGDHAPEGRRGARSARAPR